MQVPKGLKSFLPLRDLQKMRLYHHRTLLRGARRHQSTSRRQRICSDPHQSCLLRPSLLNSSRRCTDILTHTCYIQYSYRLYKRPDYQPFQPPINTYLISYILYLILIFFFNNIQEKNIKNVSFF